MREIGLGAPLCHFHVTPSGQRLEEHKEIAGAVSAVFVVKALRLSWFHRKGTACLSDELNRLLIEANHWAPGIIGFSIQFQNVFHAPYKLGPSGGNTPTFSQPGLEIVFL
jgi:hypothetical protein